MVVVIVIVATAAAALFVVADVVVVAVSVVSIRTFLSIFYRSYVCDYCRYIFDFISTSIFCLSIEVLGNCALNAHVCDLRVWNEQNKKQRVQMLDFTKE